MNNKKRIDKLEREIARLNCAVTMSAPIKEDVDLGFGPFRAYTYKDIPISDVIYKILNHLDLSISVVPATSATIKLKEKTHEGKNPQK